MGELGLGLVTVLDHLRITRVVGLGDGAGRADAAVVRRPDQEQVGGARPQLLHQVAFALDAIGRQLPPWGVGWSAIYLTAATSISAAHSQT